MRSSRISIERRRSGPSWVDIVKRRMREKTVKVGVLRGTGEHPNSDGDLTIAEIAAINEFGTGTIPARPFLRTTMRENDHYRSDLVRGLQAALKKERDPDLVLKAIGVQAAADVRNMIDTNDFAPNAPETIRRKSTNTDKNNKDMPLIDTGALRQSIQSELEE